ncbi:MAG: hypothetical protein ABIJ56_13795, partial [Pseudomonadota bacterium]
ILLVQGMNDTLVTPGRAACIVDALVSDGVSPQLCADNEANHMDVVGRNMSFVLQWLEALLRGDELPACANEELPECSEF